MENFGDYLRAGVNMGLGTDTTPHNLVEEMRKAAVLARIAARDIDDGDDRRPVPRRDGRRREGADARRSRPHRAGQEGRSRAGRSDCPQMRPARDPLRSFVYHAADRAVRDVFVDGRQVVADGRVLTLDQDGAADRLAAAQQRMLRRRRARLSRPHRRRDLAAEPAGSRLS